MMPRRLALAACTLALLAACARGGAPAADAAAAADDAGLLVALADGEEGQDTATATLLLDWRDGAPRLGAATLGILVPRAGGFRWVGTVTRCTLDEGGDEWVGSRTFVDSEQAIWVAPPGDTARLSLGGAPCASLSRPLWLARVAEARVRDSLRKVTPDSLRPTWLDDGPDEVVESPIEIDDFCSVERRTIGFVDDTIVGYSYRSSTLEFCSPGRYQTSGADVVRRLDTAGDSSRVGLYALLPARARDSLRAAFAGPLECAFNDSTGVDHAWTMRHEGGAWRLTAWFDGATVCRGGQDFPLDVPAPRALVRHAPLPMPFDSLSRLAGAHDAATSPSGRWTVLVRGDSLVVARVSATGVDSAALVAPVPAPGARRIVMLRWLGAAEVARLRREMPGLRRPAVHVVAPPPPDTP